MSARGYAVARTLLALELLGEGLTTTDFAARTGVDVRTARQLCRLLADRGYAIGVGRGRYVAGPRLRELAARHQLTAE